MLVDMIDHRISWNGLKDVSCVPCLQRDEMLLWQQCICCWYQQIC